ncbi:MAG TPA: phosphoribosylanthranilate isomerase [Tepidisphaeraceae bacterium]|nr:phosphoribosylanthranilate isomerase [Tepidisphaeraceae bacterium]
MMRPGDALAAARAGADAVGMVLHSKTKRLIDIERARQIVQALPPFVGAIGMFVDAEAKFIVETARSLGLAAVQLCGQEPPELAAALAPLPVIKAIAVNANLGENLNRWKKVKLLGLLLDSATGGSGQVNDWEAIASLDRSDLPPLIVAGGLSPSNVADVVRKLRPWAVDVSSGVEARPGEKSAELIEQFIAAVRLAEAAEAADRNSHRPE